MGNNIKSNTTFWTEINSYKILVPYYQRDYAQGRTDGGRIDNIRKVFVEELYQAIKGERVCHLGLVFGSYDTDNSIFIAVDGQQRLTTVFLLHWYVAWRENKLGDYQKLSTNFSWDTRSYSSQFVELLFRINPLENVLNAIKTNCNYFSIWENDPTVKGMLTMLEEIERQYPKNEYNLCQKLFSDDCNIRYDILKLEKKSDGKTYLKMNSRGRSLTTFELFKSKFIDEYKPSFANKFDNEWLTFMLKMSKDDDGNFADPDISYMNFINECTYMILSLHSSDDSDKEYKQFIDAKIKGNLTDVPFISFENYKTAFDNDTERFEKFFNWICTNYETIKSVDTKLRFPDSKFFAEEIIKSSNPNFSHRAKMFSLFKYAELTEYADVDEELYKRWNRVFRNLVENTDIDGDNFSKICKAINQIKNANIYSYLSNDGILNTFDKDQVKEEIAKAKQILNNDCDCVINKGLGESWEDAINKAEKYAFFKGAIRFLFQDENGNANWCDFDPKWKNAKAYFKENSELNKSAMKEKFNNADLLKALISRFTPQNCKDLLWHNGVGVFNNNSYAWRYYLLNNKIVKPIYQLMMGKRDILTREQSNVDFEQNVIYQLSNTKLLDFVIQNIPDSWIYNYHNHKAIYPSSEGVFLNADVRNDLLLHTNGIKLEEKHKVRDTDFLFGSSIQFHYNEIRFQWHKDHYVRIIDESADCKPKVKNGGDMSRREDWYYFDTAGINDQTAFVNKLNGLISQFKSDNNQLCANCQDKQCETTE